MNVPPHDRPGRSAALAPAACLLSALLAGCEPPGRPPPPPLEVTVAEPIVQEITDWDEYTGRLAATESVEVRSRVTGYLESARFVEGDLVKAGDLLFVIDPRPFRAALAEARAEADSASARLRLAENDQARAARLFKSRTIPEEELDTRTQLALQAAADLAAARAAVAKAELDLEFCSVRAPISGRIGRRLVTQGNLVTGSDKDATLLTTIVSLDPIYAYVKVDEQAYLRYLRLARAGTRPSSREVRTPVRMRLADETGWPHEGYVDFVDNQLDLSTATIEGRAIFPNPDGVLTPGLFARVQVRGEGPYRAMLVPDAAIGTDQARRFVYVVGAAGLPEARFVEPGRAVGLLRVIRTGLQGDEPVIINGLPRVRRGVPVTPIAGRIELPPDLDASRRFD